MSVIRYDEGRKTYPCTLDETTPKPTLLLDDKHKYTFNTIAEARSWAARHGWYIADYIQWLT